MSDLAAFLLARIAEDEELASARHITAGRWSAGSLTRIDSGTVGTYWRIGVPNRRDQIKVPSGYTNTRDDARHIARHDPARVLAECAAKRQVVAEFSEESLSECTDEEYRGAYSAGQVVLRALALPYADHPDFREEWQA